MKGKLFSYNYMDTPIHNLSGLTKLLCFLLLTFAVMFSYDIRAILFIMFFFHRDSEVGPNPLLPDTADGNLRSLL